MKNKQIFSIRKLKNGVASVAIATVLFGVNTNQVSATETAAGDQILAIESDSNEEAVSSLTEEVLIKSTHTVQEMTEESTAVQPLTTDSSTNPSTAAPLMAAAESGEPAAAESSAPAVAESITVPNAETPSTIDTEVKVAEVSAENQKVAAEPAANASTLSTEPTTAMAVQAVAAAADASTEQTVTPNIVRYDGQNREAVAVNVAKAHFSESQKVIIVNRDKFPDAISATNISQGLYPVLYSKAGSVDQETIALLKTLPLNEIYVLGGAVSVNDTVLTQLQQATSVKVTRVGGKDRYEANVNAIKLQYTKQEHVVIASGEIYTDALYGVSYANTIDAPVVLAKTERLEAATIALLQSLGVKKATLIGGPLTLTQSVETQLKNLGIIINRIAGANRYSGSAEVAKVAYPNPTQVVVASGEVFSDALVSAPLAQKLDAPILLVRKDQLDSEVNKYLSDNKDTIKNIYIQGGLVTITAANQDAIKKATTQSTETKTETVKENIIRYATVSQEDNTLPSGQRKVVQVGVDGYDTVTYQVTYTNGVETSRIVTGRNTTAPINEIVLLGTKSQMVATIGNLIIEGLSIDAGDLYEGYNSKNITLRMVAKSKIGSILNAYVNYDSMYGLFEQFQFINVGNNTFEAIIPLPSFYITAGVYQISLIGVVDADGSWGVFPLGNGSGLNYTSVDLSAGDFTVK